MTAPRAEDELHDEVAAVLRTHGIYGFNGSQVACRCSQREWRHLLDWHTHVADALLPLIREREARLVAEAERERDHWKDHAEEAGSGFARVCRDYAAAAAREARLRTRVEVVTDEWASSGCIHLNEAWGRIRAALADTDGGAR